MKTIAIACVISLFAVASVAAQECKAVAADGKPLAGAAKTAHLKKCCEETSKGKDGRPLAGAAKASHIKKCMAG
ncbi:MAG: hypothetical protein JOZ70_12260 [Pseudolabrys sp.]|nr:hypothetical protein [Pseudolabrys sp.]MBV9956010.1 hypothetical protein [Pseudolabrys sp.]